MTSVIYNNWKEEVMKAIFSMVADTIKVALVTSSYVPNIDSHTTFSDVTNEVTGTGYTAGGATLANKAVTQDNTDDEGVWDADDVSWTTSTITAAGAVIYDTTASNKLIAYIDFGGNKVSDNGTFTIQWSSEGIINVN